MRRGHYVLDVISPRSIRRYHPVSRWSALRAELTYLLEKLPPVSVIEVTFLSHKDRKAAWSTFRQVRDNHHARIFQCGTTMYVVTPRKE